MCRPLCREETKGHNVPGNRGHRACLYKSVSVRTVWGRAKDTVHWPLPANVKETETQQKHSNLI